MKKEITIDRTREAAILKAAEEEFLTKGYAGARTTEIAKVAGVSHTMLHYYFRTKENLFNCVYEQKVKLLSESISVFIVNKELPLLERIEKGVAAHFDFLANNPNLPRFLINEVITNPDRLEMLKASINNIANEIIGKIQTQLDEAAERKEICKIKAIDLLINIISLNVFIFIMFPIAEFAIAPIYGGESKMLANRKEENIKKILCRLKYKG